MVKIISFLAYITCVRIFPRLFLTYMIPQILCLRSYKAQDFHHTINFNTAQRRTSTVSGNEKNLSPEKNTYQLVSIATSILWKHNKRQLLPLTESVIQGCLLHSFSQTQNTTDGKKNNITDSASKNMFLHIVYQYFFYEFFWM